MLPGSTPPYPVSSPTSAVGDRLGNTTFQTPHLDHNISESGNPRIDRLQSAALRAAEHGFAVFPLWPDTKNPAVKGWPTVATTDPDIISRWWRGRAWNIGIACEPSKLVVVDLDTAHGESPPQRWAGARHGLDVFERLAAEADELVPDATYHVVTPSGGQHFYYRAPTQPPLRNTQARLGWRIDTRGRGGYIVGAESRTSSGLYLPRDVGMPAPLPDWLVDALAPAPPVPPPAPVDLAPHRISPYVGAAVADEVAQVRAAPRGQRHQILLHAALALGNLVGAGVLDHSDAARTLRSAATPHIGVDGFTEKEAETTIRDGLSYGTKRPRDLTAH